MAAVQSNYFINPERGWPGDIARPTEPHALDSGLIHVPDGARLPRPGDAVIYDNAENAFRVPTVASELRLVCGVLSYRADHVANAQSFVEYSNGDEVEVAVHGTWWVTAGSAVEYGMTIGWDLTDYQWDMVDLNGIDPTPNAAADITAIAETTSGFMAAYAADEANMAAAAVANAAANAAAGAVIANVNTALAALKAEIIAVQRVCPITCVSRLPVAAGGRVMARIGIGRAF